MCPPLDWPICLVGRSRVPLAANGAGMLVDMIVVDRKIVEGMIVGNGNLVGRNETPGIPD